MIRAQTELRFEKRNSTSKVSNQNLHFNWMSGRLATLTPDFGSSISMIDYKLQSSRAGTALLSPDNVLSSVECAEIVGAISCIEGISMPAFEVFWAVSQRAGFSPLGRDDWRNLAHKRHLLLPCQQIESRPASWTESIGTRFRAITGALRIR